MSRSNLDYGFPVASFVLVMYDWALTFGQEVELVWRQRWSLMTVLYINALSWNNIYCLVHDMRCSDDLGDRYSQSSAPISTISLKLTAAPCRNVSFIMYIVWDWMGFVVFAMLWVIIITRLHAMYQGSRKIHIFLTVTFLAVNIFNGVVGVLLMMHSSGDQLILSGTYQCSTSIPENAIFLDSISWVLATVWEVLALCLAAWIAVKHFREVRRHSVGGIFGDCFMMLMKTHVVYFASFAAAACLNLIMLLSPTISVDQFSRETEFYYGFLQILMVIQSFVLGPRLILSIREYHAKLVADCDAATCMTSIAFQERVHISTSNGV
ncbi:uncharacterized protein HD556DRAFT_1501557 [Suillus plorans]|uniref:DUF6533 domain-containing protein n=1 Tax=Suillus plorans TaxID=116603 RepID=A0A9P7AG40_9AGAM|nr:uncharacterized protein HD556DRAFT_1501557 [Suillus plorans]KAG1787619.1 hypothetical protein HD556DRAFT_1501557 [Suillus plorans]